ncbi:MAG TPA: hypothetical protein VFN62_05265, partial [Acidobacteriaceae bacterium]|nr:hypothetical protein [Acidobacteriaceae bacterium]
RTSTFSQLAYVLSLLVIPPLAIFIFIGIGTSNFFQTHGASLWVRANDSIFNMANRHCDVLIFGDSTAMTGINPEIVQRSTGSRTCNIAVTNAVLAVTNTLALDHFLEHNGRPQILLLQFSPDEFESNSHEWSKSIYPEGLLELVRHGTAEQKRDLLLNHPRQAVAFAGYIAGYMSFYFLKQAWFSVSHQRAAEDTVIVRNGFFTPPAPARTECEAEPPAAGPINQGFARSLAEGYRKAYASRADHVLVDVAPIPSCDPNLATYDLELSGVTSNSLLPLPITLFNDERHYTQAGSTEVSKLVSEQIDQLAGEKRPLQLRSYTNLSIGATRSSADLIPFGSR